ncbi:MAG: PqqD family protein [Myxococcales bacterium]|nr:PqqD family protein [Myxococcales bacterium]MDP3505842.1 PqqD family protein [Myxococcales bacterium]
MTDGLSLSTVVRVNSDTAVQRVGGRYMAATPDDRLHTFEAPDGSVSEVGERIIELVDGERTVGAIVDVLIEEFEVSREVAESDTRQFIELLLGKQVLTVG